MGGGATITAKAAYIVGSVSGSGLTTTDGTFTGVNPIADPYADRSFHLEDGRLDLDDALSRYERGVGLIKDCHARLRQAEQRILLLTGVDDVGQPLLQPFQHEATAAVKAEPARRIRRKPDETT